MNVGFLAVVPTADTSYRPVGRVSNRFSPDRAVRRVGGRYYILIKRLNSFQLLFGIVGG
ncbi:hypothetical protein SAMN06269250_2127 [Spirosoma fluviale]|uniref:Uncharacterized protein n=1 Tax=Spirosoma fluviale TaxID=1597977 RepID=A0A286FHY1_9BACT|nr:hypothetical protein SAMN06269250_2127 [Spirosoma fluviale]